MTKTLRIRLNTDVYEEPTEEDIRDAKDYVLRMSEYADLLGDRVMNVLREAAERIVLICYKYNIRPQDFQISANKQMQDEVYEVMDEVEEEIYGLMEEYATRCTDDRNIIALLLAWMLLLGNKNKNLHDTLTDKLRQFLYDLEAQIAAMKMAGYGQQKAVERVLSTLTSVYSSPEVIGAIMRPLRGAAFYIRQGGVHHGNVGQSSSGINNVISMVKTTLAMVWQRALFYIYRLRGASGYLTLRGSDYDCGKICDTKTGFHKLDDKSGYPPFHPHCYCYIVPVYKKEQT